MLLKLDTLNSSYIRMCVFILFDKTYTEAIHKHLTILFKYFGFNNCHDISINYIDKQSLNIIERETCFTEYFKNLHFAEKI